MQGKEARLQCQTCRTSVLGGLESHFISPRARRSKLRSAGHQCGYGQISESWPFLLFVIWLPAFHLPSLESAPGALKEAGAFASTHTDGPVKGNPPSRSEAKSCLELDSFSVSFWHFLFLFGVSSQFCPLTSKPWCSFSSVRPS